MILGRIKQLDFKITFWLICCCISGFAQSSTNQGKEFWTGYMAHIEDNGPSQMALYITSDFNTSGVVDIADNSFAPITFQVKAKEVTIVNVPRSAFLQTQGQFKKGLHIVAQKKIAIYAHIYSQSVSGATLLLPVTVLSRSYYSINYTQQSNSTTQPSYSTFMVIATEDNTTVEITPSKFLLDGKAAGTPFTINLNKGEVYQGLSVNDLTYTTIRSISTANGDCKKIAVFSGSSKIGIGCPGVAFSSDNLFQQVYPTVSWGKNYITVPLKNRNYDVFRVILSDPATKIIVNGVVVATNGGSGDLPYYEFKSQHANVISADKPIQVVQYAVSQGNVIEDGCQVQAGDLGDPEMIYLTPLEQTLDHVTLYSPDSYNIQSSYINVVIKTDIASTFLIDGVHRGNFMPITGNPAYSYAQIDVVSSTSYLSAAGGFNAIAYGFGRAESYGFAAGTNLQNLNEFISFSTPISTVPLVNGCSGVDYKLQLTIPYQTNRIKWDFKDGSAVFVDDNPVLKSTEVKGDKTLYTYEYFKTVKYTPGDFTITATVLNLEANECGSETDIDFDFNISDYPKPQFTSVGICPGETTKFKDITDATNTILKTWHWDFGDGQTSDLQNPEHIYTTSGTYNVVLTVTNENGCASSASIPTKILAKPSAAFDFKSVGCIGLPVTVADKSTSIDGVIKQWIWDFKDGTIETRTDNAAFTHIYTQLGTYKVKLSVVTDKGCVGEFENTISVEPLPVVDFSTPSVCIADALAQFFDKSTISSNAEQFFNYSWNFGDSRANAANPNTSTIKNPKHRYTAAGVYTVTLTVTSGTGCPETKAMQFTVNGSTPQAKFTVLNAAGLCSASEVILQDQSTVDFGSINKVLIYYDYSNHPELFDEFDKASMPADGRYKHLYPLATDARRYTIRMQAFSGGVCESTTQQEVEVKGNPQVTFIPTPPLCQNHAPVQLLVNNNGFAGTGTFAGTNVSPAGIFSPKTVGTFAISYHFISAGGCDVTQTQDIVVNQIPVVNAGGNFTMLEGGIVQIKATANGTGLNYKWTPSAGLDRDDVLQPNASPVANVVYKLSVTNASGCIISDEISVTVLKKPVVVNTFTPNNDGVNDLWRIAYLESYPGCTVDIFNRQGEKVYSSVGYASPWDGKYKGDILPTGTYYYIINPKNGRKPFSGYVTIIR